MSMPNPGLPIGHDALVTAADRSALERQDTDMDRVFVPSDVPDTAQNRGTTDCSQPIPETVYFVVHSSDLLGHREHLVRSLLFESRSAAVSKLQQMRRAEPMKTFDVWQSSFYSEPKTWGYDVVLSSGRVMTRNGGGAQWTERPSSSTAGLTPS